MVEGHQALPARKFCRSRGRNIV